MGRRCKGWIARLGDKHLNIALRHTQAVPLHQPRPTHKLAKVLALMKWAVSCWTDEDCAAVIRRLVGLEGPRQRPSLLIQVSCLERCEGGCLAREDYRDAKKYRDDEIIRAVGVSIGAVKWMKEMRFISEEEYDNSMKHIMEKKKPRASGDDLASSSGPAAPADMPAVAPEKRTIATDEIEWVRKNPLPQIKRMYYTK